jgi:hypothetical protein
MPEPDLNFVLRRLDTIQKELREGLALMELRDQVREANYQTTIQTLTKQMVSVATTVEERLIAMDGRLDRIETTVNDIRSKFE